jgi:periplasmic divalent cation tolerance protein
MIGCIQVITVAGSREEAEKIVQAVVEKRLAGCAQIVGPITSTYWGKTRSKNLKSGYA